MKKTFSLLAVSLLCVVAANCDKQPNPASEELIEVSLSVNGEILSTSDMPLTRAGGNKDIYVITVNNTGGLTPYAYGLFNNLEGAKLRVYTGRSYSIHVWCFKGGMDYYSFGCVQTGNTGKQLHPSDVNNDFTYSAESTYNPLNNEGLNTSATETVYNIDYYYGYIGGFTPNTSSSLSVELKRAIFGVSVSVENLTEGKVEVVLGNRDRIVLTPESGKYESTYCFYNYRWPGYDWLYGILNYSQISQEASIKVLYTNSKGEQDTIAEDNVTFYRNMRKTITVRLKPQQDTKADSAITLNLESVEMTDDSHSVTIEQ